VYSRLFITLKADSSGYGFGGRSPSGRCVLEQRGNICKAALTAQDLKPGVGYKVYIIEKSSPQGEAPRGVSAGSLDVDAQGRGELRKEFQGAFGGKIAFEDVAVVAVVAAKAAGRDIALVGFENDDNAKSHKWRNFTDTAGEPRPPESRAETPLAKEERAEIAAEPEPAADAEPFAEAEPIADTATSAVAEPEQPTLLEPEPAPAAEAAPEQETAPVPEPTREHTASAQNLAPPEPPPVYAKNPARPQGHGEIENIFANNVELQPFAHKHTDIRWVRASLKELAVLPIEYWPVMNSGLAVLCNERYGHLILGRDNNDPGRVLVGIPAVFEGKQLPSAQSIGFTRFEYCDDRQAGEREHGYWMLESRIS